jgi:hypothetical protein
MDLGRLIRHLKLLYKPMSRQPGFKFPLFMSLAHMAFSFLALLPIMFARQFRELHVPTWQKQWMGIVAISTFFAVNVSHQVSGAV